MSAPESGGPPIGPVPLSLYLHFPWCVRKCPYCDFNSHGLHSLGNGEVPEQDYIDALLRDLEYELERPEPREVASIFMGGGTPSLFSDRAIGRLLEQLSRRLHFAADIEITMETNPGTVDAAHFRGYRSAGVNRLSIGVQSLDDSQLKRLGRIHGREDALRAVDTARQAGFGNLNLDLMFALPEQSPQAAEQDLRDALALGPEHLSYYQLTLEPNTEFAARPPMLPDDETAWTMQLAAQALLADHGFGQYEVSAYAQAGRHCRHNRNYWTFGDYLGLGAGAHSKRSFGTVIERRARHKHPRRYLESAGTAAAIQEQREIGREELAFEFAMNALRLNEGFALDTFSRHTGLDPACVEAPLARARRKGLLDESAGSVKASAFGRAHLNALLREFL